MPSVIPWMITRFDWITMSLPATPEPQPIERDTRETLMVDVANLTAVVAVNPEISIETVSRRCKAREEEAMEDGESRGGTKVELHRISQSTQAETTAVRERKQHCEQPISQ